MRHFFDAAWRVCVALKPTCSVQHVHGDQYMYMYWSMQQVTAIDCDSSHMAP